MIVHMCILALVMGGNEGNSIVSRSPANTSDICVTLSAQLKAWLTRWLGRDLRRGAEVQISRPAPAEPPTGGASSVQSGEGRQNEDTPNNSSNNEMPVSNTIPNHQEHCINK